MIANFMRMPFGKQAEAFEHNLHGDHGCVSS